MALIPNARTSTHCGPIFIRRVRQADLSKMVSNLQALQTGEGSRILVSQSSGGSRRGPGESAHAILASKKKM